MRAVVWTIREAEAWTPGGVAGGILLLVVVMALVVWGLLVTLRR